MNDSSALRRSLGSLGPILLAVFCLASAGCGRLEAETITLPQSAVRCRTNYGSVRDVAFTPGAVWLATEGGLAVYRTDTGRWDQITMAQGLPSAAVLSLTVDSAGVVWAGTKRGLCSIQDGNPPAVSAVALPRLAVNILAVLEPGILYAGTERGIMRLQGGRWRPVDDSHEFSRRPVRDMIKAGDGSLWFAKDKALTRYAGGNWETYHHLNITGWGQRQLLSNNVLSLAAAGTDVWVGSDRGLHRVSGGSWERLYPRPRLDTRPAIHDVNIASLTVDTSGLLWAAHGRGSEPVADGVGRRSPDGGWTYLTRRDGLPSDVVHRLRMAPDATVWMATDGGAASWDGRRITALIPPSDLPDNHLIQVAAVASGGIVALMGQTVAEMDEGPARFFNAPLTLVGGMAAVGEGIAAAAGHDGRIYMWTADGWREEKPVGAPVRCLALNADGQVWILTGRGELRRLIDGKWSQNEASAPSGVSPLSIHGGRGSDIWLAAERREKHGRTVPCLFRLAGRSWREISVPGTAAGERRGIVFDDRGKAAYLAGNGLWLRHNESWAKAALPFNDVILSACWDKWGRLWLGTRDEGLVYQDIGRWRRIVLSGGASIGGVSSIAVQSRQRVWLGTVDQGIIRLDL